MTTERLDICFTRAAHAGEGAGTGKEMVVNVELRYCSM
jgi:hypothetical protein